MKKLSEIWFGKFQKSEFEPTTDYYEIFEKHGLYPGRIISAYKESPEGHVVVFNGNVVTEKAGKIWFGDLNITLEFDKLKEIADEISEDLYIVREQDARFEKENIGFKYWKEHAVEIIKCKK